MSALALCSRNDGLAVTLKYRFVSSKTEAAQFDVSWKVPAILYYAKRNYHTKYDLRSKCFRLWTFSCRWGALLMLCCLPQLKTPSMPACCWRRPRWLGSRGRVTPLSSPSWSARCRRPETWWGWMPSLSHSTRWVRRVLLPAVYHHTSFYCSDKVVHIQVLKARPDTFAGRGRASQWRHKIDHQAQSDVCGQDHLREGPGAQRGGALHRRLHLHSGAGELRLPKNKRRLKTRGAF